MTKAKEFYNIEYIPTGLIYPMHKVDVDRLVVEEPENFRVIDEDYLKPIAPQSEPTVFDKVVVNEEVETEETSEEEIADVNLEECSVAYLKELCAEKGIECPAKLKKAEIIKLLKKKA